MKYVLKSEDVKGQICELIALRAKDERKRSNSAKSLREECAHARGARVLSDLYEDLMKAEVMDGQL